MEKIYETWQSFFIEVFKEIEENLAIVINAAGCRERWLQAEFFRLANGWDGKDFKVDYPLKNATIFDGFHEFGKYESIDFYGKKPCPMIAELKVIGGGYKNKAFAGKKPTEAVIRLLDNEVVLNDLSSQGEAKGSSLLKDFCRLVSIESIDQLKPEKYMLLVIPRHYNHDKDTDKEIDIPTPLGNCLQKFQMDKSIAEEICEPIEYNYFQMRIWKVV